MTAKADLEQLFITEEQLAELRRVGVRTLRNLVSNSPLPFLGSGDEKVFLKDDALAWLKQQMKNQKKKRK